MPATAAKTGARRTFRAKTLDWARQAAQTRGASAAASKRIDRPTLDAWRADDQRTLYVFDVRDPGEYEAGHLAGAISAPGGQLVQATDQYVGTLGARIVLVDDAEVRAAMTASWLRQMGFADVFVLAEAGTETGWPETPMLETDTPPRRRHRLRRAERTFLRATRRP